jgi:hypothetical protein
MNTHTILKENNNNIFKEIKKIVEDNGFRYFCKNENKIVLQYFIDGRRIDIHIRSYDHVAHASHTLCSLPNDLAQEVQKALENTEAKDVGLKIYMGSDEKPNNIAIQYRFPNFNPRSFMVRLNKIYLREIVKLQRRIDEVATTEIINWIKEKMLDIGTGTEIF